MKAYALTTADNPYDPFDQFDDWSMYDHTHGWCCSELLARIAFTSSQLTDEENNHEIEIAINEIIKYDMTNNYRKIIKDLDDQPKIAT